MLGPLSEIILYVADMDAQVRFYRDVLGLRIVYPADLDDYSAEFWVELDAGACRLCLHGGGQGERGRDAPKFVFSVEDIEAAHRSLQERSVEVGEIRSPAPGVHVADCHDPEGNAFSIESRLT